MLQILGPTILVDFIRVNDDVSIVIYMGKVIWIHTTKGSMNRNEDNYELPHISDDVI